MKQVSQQSNDDVIVHLEENFAWKSFLKDGLIIHHTGNPECLSLILKALVMPGELSAESLGFQLKEQIGHFSAILDGPDFTIAFVDHCRSTPVFYGTNGRQFTVSNSARRARSDLDIVESLDIATLEFAMSGYVTGENTVFKGLKQLQAGEILLWQKSDGKLETARYYKYLPNNLRTSPMDELCDELDNITNNMMRRSERHPFLRQVFSQICSSRKRT